MNPGFERAAQIIKSELSQKLKGYGTLTQLPLKVIRGKLIIAAFDDGVRKHTIAAGFDDISLQTGDDAPYIRYKSVDTLAEEFKALTELKAKSTPDKIKTLIQNPKHTWPSKIIRYNGTAFLINNYDIKMMRIRSQMQGEPQNGELNDQDEFGTIYYIKPDDEYSFGIWITRGSIYNLEVKVGPLGLRLKGELDIAIMPTGIYATDPPYWPPPEHVDIIKPNCYKLDWSYKIANPLIKIAADYDAFAKKIICTNN